MTKHKKYLATHVAFDLGRAYGLRFAGRMSFRDIGRLIAIRMQDRILKAVERAAGSEAGK